jgi:alkylated DNA nucleotide flippase Atl1
VQLSINNYFISGGILMGYKKKSWKEKLSDDKGLPKIVTIEGKLIKKWGTGTCVIPAPREVDEIMKKVPKGKLVTINQIREKLARKHRATIGCPITTGIFASIAARAAAEQLAEGKKNITPYWRTLKSKGEINEKYPGGVNEQKKLLKNEGHSIVQKGKRSLVIDFEKHLVTL